MQIEESRLWSRPDIVTAILRNSFVLDPTVLMHNPRVYLLSDNSKLRSFCAVVDHGICRELKAVYTKPEWRNFGYSSRVLEHALKDNPECYLVCKNSLKNFYERNNFKTVEEAPFPLTWRKNVYNKTLGRFTNPLITMRSTRL